MDAPETKPFDAFPNAAGITRIWFYSELCFKNMLVHMSFEDLPNKHRGQMKAHFA